VNGGAEPQNGQQGELLPNWLLLRSATGGAVREAALELLGTTCPPVRRWSEGGRVFALCDPAAGPEETPAGAALTVPIEGTATVELRALAVASEWRDQHVSTRLLTQVLDALRADGVRMVVAALSDREAQRMERWLERMGFHRVEPGPSAPPLPSSLVTSGEGATDGALTWFGQEL
jgi:N-acetylglutamate synthase-like GNAT family acetyltransferase